MSPKSEKNGSNDQVKAVKHNKVAHTPGLQQMNAAGVGGWMDKIKPRPQMQTVSANELTSLSALIAYAAFKTGTSEFRIERDLADRFNVPNIKCLPAARFDEALRYLVDRVPVRAA